MLSLLHFLFPIWNYLHNMVYLESLEINKTPGHAHFTVAVLTASIHKFTLYVVFCNQILLSELSK